MSFSKDFLWGAASAAYQVEGAFDEDGKGPGIWDALTREPGHVACGENGDVSCDHYHRYKEDVALMKKIGLKSYRFSISWPRVLPEGKGQVNEAGVQFYVNLVDELLAAGIEPMVTLYHWNLPFALYELGGWKNPESVQWFEDYAELMTTALAGKVKYWITFNEPQVFVGAGMLGAVHAPFEHNEPDAIIDVSKHILLAHGRAVSVIRKNCKDAKISFAPSTETVVPKETSKDCIEEARQRTFAITPMFPGCISWWADSIYKGRFHEDAIRMFGEERLSFSEEEWKSISQPVDFFAFNVYQAGGNPFPPNPYDYDLYSYQGSPKTSMGWNVTPDVMYWCCRFFYERYNKPVMISENGMAANDWVSLDGKVHDANRIDFVHRYLLSLKKAIDEGIPVIGYQYWSIMDNFEWAAGYDPRFGLIYVNYQTLERTLKDSALWYGEVIKSSGEIL